MTSKEGEVIVYEDDTGKTAVAVHLHGETVWLTQSSIAELFQTSVPNISMHIRNIYDEEELQVDATVKKFLTVRREGKRDVKRELNYFNLDMIISVGYRVKSSIATQFRIWATKILKDHLVRGFTVNQLRLAEKGVHEAQQVLSLLADTLEDHDLVSDDGRSVLSIVNRYARTWQLLLQYDEDRLPLSGDDRTLSAFLEISQVRKAINALKKELLKQGEATELFGNERSQGLAGIIGSVYQTFDGHDLYPSREEKAANLLYFIIKDHPFTDGNKRIGSFLFIMFLQLNDMLVTAPFDNRALVALTLLTAASDPSQKDVLIRLIVNLLFDNIRGES